MQIKNTRRSIKNAWRAQEATLSHCVKSVRVRSYSGPYFPAFGLDTNQNNSEYGHFLRSELFSSHLEGPMLFPWWQKHFID